MSKTYDLTGGSPWGFRLVGGHDFRTALAVSKVTPGGKADRAGIEPGMILSEINGSSTKSMTHVEAQNKVKSAGASLKLTVETEKTAPPAHDYGQTTQQAPVSKPPKQTSTAYIPAKQWQPPASSAPPPPSDFLPPPPSSMTHTQQEEALPPPPQNLLVPELKEDKSQEDPICDGCRKVIHGPYLSHKGRNWHIDEFVCAAGNCRKPLQNIGFIEENGQRYCQDCYEKHFAHSCGKCHKKIIGEVMHALNQTWHMTCFVCTACSQTFKEGVFQMQNDKPYCVADYNRLFGQTCKGCSFPIEAGDQYLEALNAQWHDSCFQCAVCHLDLKNVGFFSAGGKPVCSNHRNARVA